ncbi:MAG: HEAT repeat domain-containing protein [Planctomycetales bacterium]|nr:HEAT repeat domain-containing protein [Planctomycetales bacterium]
MTYHEEVSEEVGRMIADLADSDAAKRERTRAAIVQREGPEIVRALVNSLIDRDRHVRWEAAKCLAAISDPVAAPALMVALEDEDPDVRWVAGEGLIALGKVGVLIVLSGLTKRATSIEFCKGAHHVLHDSKLRAKHPEIREVLSALEQNEPAALAPATAYQAMIALS